MKANVRLLAGLALAVLCATIALALERGSNFQGWPTTALPSGRQRLRVVVDPSYLYRYVA